MADVSYARADWLVRHPAPAAKRPVRVRSEPREHETSDTNGLAFTRFVSHTARGDAAPPDALLSESA
jgi:hypothetical protein